MVTPDKNGEYGSWHFSRVVLDKGSQLSILGGSRKVVEIDRGAERLEISTAEQDLNFVSGCALVLLDTSVNGIQGSVRTAFNGNADGTFRGRPNLVKDFVAHVSATTTVVVASTTSTTTTTVIVPSPPSSVIPSAAASSSSKAASSTTSCSESSATTAKASTAVMPSSSAAPLPSLLTASSSGIVVIIVVAGKGRKRHKAGHDSLRQCVKETV